MFEVHQTTTFQRWFARLKDRQARDRILARITMLEQGNVGDSRSVGGGVSEMRIHTGPGYRVYYRRKDRTVFLLLCGGDKGSQRSDISRAQKLAREF
jgi:putative addiction module killer protein